MEDIKDTVEKVKKKAKQWRNKDRVNKVRSDAKWDVRCAEMAARLIAAGCSYEDVGVIIGVSFETINSWVKRYESFEQAAKQGHDAANAMTLGQLLRAAWGYDYQEKDEKYIELLDENGVATGKKKLITIVKTRHQPPNPALLEFIAVNKLSDEFKHKTEIEVNSNKQITITGTMEANLIEGFAEKFLEQAHKTKLIESKVIDESSGNAGEVVSVDTEGSNSEPSVSPATP